MPQAKKVHDVESPGATPAPATSRPVIVSKGPALQDPMVQEKPVAPAPEKRQPPSAIKKVIAPISEPKTPEPKAAATPEGDDDAADQTLDVPAVNDVQKQSEAEQKQEEETAELVRSLIAEKKYVVPIETTQEHWLRVGGIVFMVIVLVAIAFVAAIDAGLFLQNISLPFDVL